LSGLGGVLGVLSGMGLLQLVSSVATRTTELGAFDIGVNPQSVLVSLSFSAFVGIFFGFYPARRAASLDPIEALRYE
jgi:putative ABC transport system permease protein